MNLRSAIIDLMHRRFRGLQEHDANISDAQVRKQIAEHAADTVRPLMIA